MSSDSRIDAVPTWVRRVVLEANGGWCTYCGSDRAEAVDHVIPLSRGGRDDVSNLVPACKPCNSSKRNRTVLEWKQALILDGQLWPEYVTALTDEGTSRTVADAQREVMERARLCMPEAAERLLGDASRLVTQLGNLDEGFRRRLVGEVVRLCEQSEREVAAGPEARQIMRGRTARERRSILGELRRAHRHAASPSGGTGTQADHVPVR